jgi:hypothetical protein
VNPSPITFEFNEVRVGYQDFCPERENSRLIIFSMNTMWVKSVYDATM